MTNRTVDKYTDKAARIPFVDPLLLILKSRRFMTASVGLLVYILIQLVPALAPIAPEIGTVAAALFALVVGGYSIEDALTAWGNVQANNLKQELPELFGDLARDAIGSAIQDAVNEAAAEIERQNAVNELKRETQNASDSR